MQQPALIDREIEVNERIVTAEVEQDLGQPGEGKVIGHADAQAPARSRSAEIGGRLLARGHDVAREPDHRLAVSCQRHGVGVPEHERSADLLFQAPDVLADGRLLDAEPGCGAGEAARLLDGEERGQQLRIVVGHKQSQ